MKTSRGRVLVLIWVAMLLAPIAWGASLAAMFWLTDVACAAQTRMPVLVTGLICVALALGSGLLAVHGSHRYAEMPEAPQSSRFLFAMAKGGSAIFALVIALSLVPVAMLSPCRM
jgi:F0F1-type ATP synthase membrane subunit c/vacuolar-type H+-ATPase subunit K